MLKIEARVGLFVVLSLGLLLAFVAALSHIQLRPGVPLHVDFAYCGALQKGAVVRISGVDVGRVARVDLRLPAPLAGPLAPVVRARLSLHKEVFDQLGSASKVGVATAGVLGEPYIEIAPGGGTALQEGAVVRGIDAPRLHVMTLHLQGVLAAFHALMGDDATTMPGVAGPALARLLQNTDALLTAHQQDFTEGIGNMVASARDAAAVAAALHSALGDGAQVRQLLRDAQQSARIVHTDLPSLLAATQHAVNNLQALSDKTNQAMDANALAALANDLSHAAREAHSAASDAAAITRAIRLGEGSVGGFWQDPQLYDDIKELIRDLRRHPWKVLWKD